MFLVAGYHCPCIFQGSVVPLHGRDQFIDCRILPGKIFVDLDPACLAAGLCIVAGTGLRAVAVRELIRAMECVSDVALPGCRSVDRSLNMYIMIYLRAEFDPRISPVVGLRGLDTSLHGHALRVVGVGNQDPCVPDVDQTAPIYECSDSGDDGRGGWVCRCR
jgi:hypothetical protein